jgi:hypothetical protein
MQPLKSHWMEIVNAHNIQNKLKYFYDISYCIFIYTLDNHIL